MSKFFKKVLICVLGAIMCFSGCTQPGEGPETPVDPVEPVPDERYDEEFVSPSYAEVDESGYTVYYFSAEGNDANDGLSESSPKQTVAAANAVVDALAENYTPTKLLFERGSVFTDGTLELTGYAAAEEKPLIVDAYGEGDRPAIRLDGAAHVIYVTASNTRVFNMEVSNKTGQVGIHVVAEAAGAMENIVISGCYIHDVNYNWTGEGDSEDAELDISGVRAICPDERFVYEYGGIIFNTQSSTRVGPSWYQDVWIENNTIRRVARSGMFITTQWARRPGMDWGVNKYSSDEAGYYPSYRVVIKNNTVSHTGGDGIVLLASRDSFIEGNTSYHANWLGRSGFYNAGIWPHSCVNLVMQYNEAAYCHLDNGAGDGQGFDIDIGCSEIYFQYNYSHHNAGGGILLCNSGTDNFVFYDEEGNAERTERAVAPWHDVYIRNNVFADNGRQGSSSAFVISSYIYNLFIDNNTVVMPEGLLAQDVLNISDYSGFGIGEKFYFRNNIFLAPEGSFASIDVLASRDYTFSGNLFLNFSESVLVTAGIEGQYAFDPQITRPDDPDGYEKYSAYRAENALVYESGRLLDKMALYDIAGNNASGITYIGAFCK